MGYHSILKVGLFGLKQQLFEVITRQLGVIRLFEIGLRELGDELIEDLKCLRKLFSYTTTSLALWFGLRLRG